MNYEEIQYDIAKAMQYEKIRSNNIMVDFDNMLTGIPTQKNINMILSEDDDCLPRHLAKVRFKSIYASSNYIEVFVNFHMNGTLFDIVDFHKSGKIFDTSELKIEYHDTSLIEVYDKSLSVMIKTNATEPFKKNQRRMYCTIIGDPKKVEKLYKKLYEKSNTSQPTLEWTFKDSDGRIRSKTFDLQKEKCYDEFYPFINQPLIDYYQGFIDSKASILILTGVPGSGKTSFVRNLLYIYGEKGLKSLVAYDENLMVDDRLFIDYFESDNHFLVLEDADILLLNRKDDHNKAMSKILSASDGLVKTGKKYIFTANITNESRIDDALTRPGRLYDLVNFRTLTESEAKMAANASGLEFIPGKNEYTLAELFNNTNKNKAKKSKAKMGF